MHCYFIPQQTVPLISSSPVARCLDVCLLPWYLFLFTGKVFTLLLQDTDRSSILLPSDLDVLLVGHAISHLTFQVRQRLFLDRKNIVIILYIVLYYCRKLIFELDLAQNQTWKVKKEDIVFRNSVNMFDTSVSGHILNTNVHTYIHRNLSRRWNKFVFRVLALVFHTAKFGKSRSHLQSFTGPTHNNQLL